MAVSASEFLQWAIAFGIYPPNSSGGGLTPIGAGTFLANTTGSTALPVANSLTLLLTAAGNLSNVASPSAARTNLQLQNMSLQNSDDVDITGGTAVLSSLSTPFTYFAVTGDTNITINDALTAFEFTTDSISLSDALGLASFTDGMTFSIKNTSSGSCQFIPKSGEFIDGNASLTLAPQQGVLITKDPDQWSTISSFTSGSSSSPWSAGAGAGSGIGGDGTNTAAGTNALSYGDTINRAIGNSSQAFGSNNTAQGYVSHAIGQSNNVSGDYSFGGGNSSTASAAYTFAFGNACTATAQNAFAFGASSNAMGNCSLAFGSGATASGVNSIAIGASSQCGGNNGYALGSTAQVNAIGGYAIGSGATINTGATRSVAIGAGATASNSGSMVLTDNNAANHTDSASNQFVTTFAGGYYNYVASSLATSIDTNSNLITHEGEADQSYSYQVPSSGSTIIPAAGVRTLVLAPGGLINTLTISLASLAPIDGQVFRVYALQDIKTLTISGATINNAPSSLPGGQGFELQYNLANTTWNPLSQPEVLVGKNFTPTVGGSSADPSSVTYAYQVGAYQVIGNTVHFQCRVILSALTIGSASGQLQIRGLPFASADVVGQDMTYAINWNQLTIDATTQQLVGFQLHNTDYINIVEAPSTTANGATMAVGNLTSTSDINISGWYFWK